MTTCFSENDVVYFTGKIGVRLEAVVLESNKAYSVVRYRDGQTYPELNTYLTPDHPESQGYTRQLSAGVWFR